MKKAESFDENQAQNELKKVTKKQKYCYTMKIS